MEKLREKLIDLGLKEKEAVVYLAVLSFKRSTVTDINKKSGITRTNIYQYLELLLRKGLIYKTTFKKRIYYSAENPQRIITYLNQEKSKIEERKNKIEKIIPELKNIFSDSLDRPSVKFYEGKDSIKLIYEEIVGTHKNVYSYFSSHNFFDLFNQQENHKLLMQLHQNGGQLYNLLEKDNKDLKKHHDREYGKFIKTKILPSEIKFETDLLIFGDQLVLISFQNLVGIVIEDKAIAEMQRSIFKYLWKITR